MITFGEALFRFSTLKGERLRSASRLDFHLGGTEFNVAANLKSLGIPAQWVSVVPDGMIGDLIIDRIHATGLTTDFVKRAHGRAGWYMLETGTEPRPDHVISRNSSVLAEAAVEIEWEKVFDGAEVFHTSGVTAGLSEKCTADVANAMITAKKLGLQVSYDFNFRANLWSIEEAVRRQKPLLEHVDVLFCGRQEIDLFFEGKKPTSVFDHIVMSERGEGERGYRIEISSGNEVARSKTFEFERVDRIGVGDSMTAGFWAAKLAGKSLEETADFAAAAGAMKYSIPGDVALLKHSEVSKLVKDGY
ncbi:MAG: sugar kinase, partial [Bdellovibrionota bacterium]